MMDNYTLISFFALGFLVKATAILFNRNKRPKNLEHVGYLSKLDLYPGKSMQGITLENGICLSTGLKHPTKDIVDRCLLVVMGDQFISSKNTKFSSLVSIKVQLQDSNRLILSGDCEKPLEIILARREDHRVLDIKVLGEPIEGQDCGDEAAKWISDYLNFPGLRLVISVDGLKRRRLQDRKDKWTVISRSHDEITYQNYYPYLLHTEASLHDYNEVTGETLEMERFRPNFVVSGCKAFDEDNWAEIWIGNLKFSNHKPCQRCNVTMLDPLTGEKHATNEPLTSLGKYRVVCEDYPSTPIFGALLVLDNDEGPVRVGDPVYVRRKTQEDYTLW